MLGAIIGDLAGSVYEYEQMNNVKPIIINDIIEDDSFYSDDTILTISIIDCVINNKDYDKTLRDYVNNYNIVPNIKPYFENIFSPGMVQWAKGNIIGNSCGNGAMMRISPIGYLFDTEEEVIEQSRLATAPSHNSKEAIECAQTVALIILYARQGLSKKEIISKLNLTIIKPEVKSFNITCNETIDVCLWSLFNAENFKDSIRLAVSFGGDTDTNACIVGSMAEAMYGIDDDLRQKALKKLPKKFVAIINDAYSRVSNIKVCEE